MEVCGDTGRRYDVRRAKRRLSALSFSLPLLLTVASCVAVGPGKQSDLASVLTPAQIEKTGAAEGTLSLAGETAAAPKPDSPDTPAKVTTQTALSAETTKPTAAEEAAAEAASGKTEKAPAAEQTPAVAPAEDKKPEPSAVARTDEQETSKPETVIAEKKEAEEEKPKVRNLFSGLFANNQAGRTDPATARPATKRAASEAKKKRRRSRIARLQEGGIRDGLPGVRTKGLFGVNDEIEVEELDEPVRVAGLSSLARRGSHGLLLQRPDVRVGCFPAKLVRILKAVERKFGRTPIVTSGYRSASYNRKVRGARNSTHVRCMAADIQVKGVSKWTLSKYLRSLPGRGGVGTYCHTKSVHVDIGKVRAWHHCRRRARRRA